MIRRCLLLLAMLLSVPAAAETADVALARDAFRFGFPIYEMARTRAAAITRQPINVLVHRRTLANDTSREVTTPNNDTLYSSAWLDLSNGPVILTMPALPDRYHSAALMDLFTDNFAILGTRANLGKGGRFVIAGPGWTGAKPDGAALVRSPTNDVWLLIRTVVDGPADLERARAAQEGYGLQATSPAQLVKLTAIPTAPDAATFFDVVGAMLARAPVPPQHRVRLNRLAATGLKSGATWASLSPSQQAVWQANFPAFVAELRGGLSLAGTIHDGWSYPAANTGNFGQDDRTRSLIALGGLAALPPVEAMYLTARTDGAGQPLDGTHSYRLHIPAGGVPVGAFWSLTMYQVENDGRLFFTPNPQHRFGIGDRTPGLVTNTDGSIDIGIGNVRPAGIAEPNWLPAPAGPFRTVLRAYLPKAPLLTGKWHLPPIERLP